MDRQMLAAMRFLYRILESPLPALLENQHEAAMQNRLRKDLWAILGEKLQTNHRKVVEMEYYQKTSESVVFTIELERVKDPRDTDGVLVTVKDEKVKLWIMFHVYGDWTVYAVLVRASDKPTQQLIGRNPQFKFDIWSELPI
jgi:hypothetical protein